MKKFVTFVPPSFEDIQHEVLIADPSDPDKALCVGFHSDVSLLQRLDRLQVSASTAEQLKAKLQPLLDSANQLVPQLETSLGKISDKELLSSCPSRYVQTLSEQKEVLEALNSENKKIIEDTQHEAELSAKKQKELDESKALDDSINEILKRL